MSHSSVDAAAVCKFESFSALLAEENKGTLLDVAREVLRRENPDSWRAFSGSLAHDLVHGHFLSTVGWGGRNKTKLLQLLQEGLKDLVTKSTFKWVFEELESAKSAAKKEKEKEKKKSQPKKRKRGGDDDESEAGSAPEAVSAEDELPGFEEDFDECISVLKKMQWRVECSQAYITKLESDLTDVKDELTAAKTKIASLEAKIKDSEVASLLPPVSFTPPPFKAGDRMPMGAFLHGYGTWTGPNIQEVYNVITEKGAFDDQAVFKGAVTLTTEELKGMKAARYFIERKAIVLDSGHSAAGGAAE